MTHLDTAARISSTAHVAATGTRTGPSLIDPRDFKLIAGGLPKGGWIEPEGANSNTQLPKGGWATANSNAQLPKGGW
jgi:hypothetical protein